MRWSEQHACSRALMHASTMACATSSISSLSMPSSRARSPAAFTTAISMSGTNGKVSSIVRCTTSFIPPSGSELQEQIRRDLDPVRDPFTNFQSEENHRVQYQKSRNPCLRVHPRSDFLSDCSCDLAHLR